MSSNLQNSIWPNTDGNLGNIKVQIPDGVTTTWPTGDALVGNFVYHKGKLVGFVDTKALIANSSKSTTFPYEYVNISLPSIAEGEMTYNYDQCVYFVLNGKVLKGDVPTNEELVIITKKYAGCKTLDDIKAVDPNYLTTDIVNGVWSEGLGDLEDVSIGEFEGMFKDCTNLTSFNSDLSSLENGNFMFYNTNIKTFTPDLPNLTNARSMFMGCSKLETFDSDLSSVQNGYGMFASCANLISFSSDLPSLTLGNGMFKDCNKLTTFDGDLSSLTDALWMFMDCSQLTSFNSDLSSLLIGGMMFAGCKLDTDSVQNIADTINTVTGQYSFDIGIGNSTPNQQEEAAFNKMVSKGWTVYVNGSQFTSSCGTSCCASCCSSSCCATCCASLTTLDETDDEFVAPIPFWAKPVPSDEQHAQYVDSEGNFYNILGAQFIYGDNLETYGMFTSLEDAAANMRLKKIGEEEIETA